MKLTPKTIKQAHRHLRASDPVMKAMIDAVGPFTLRFERNRFGMLVRSIVSQQISTKAARSIRNRLHELVGPGGFTAANLIRFNADQLRSAGLSVTVHESNWSFQESLNLRHLVHGTDVRDSSRIAR